MRHRIATGWVWFAVTIATITIGAGWVAAWQADRFADQHWADLVLQEANDITQVVSGTLDRDQLQLYAFARSLPEGSERVSFQFDAIFALETAALYRRQTSRPFDGLAYAVWVPAEDRDTFESRYGIALLGPSHLPSTNQGDGFVVLYVNGSPENLFIGLDLAEVPTFTQTVSKGFRSQEPTIGPSFPSKNGYLAPITVCQGDNGIVLGLLNLTKLAGNALLEKLPDGMSVTISDGENVLFETSPVRDSEISLTTKTSKGNLNIGFSWQANNTFLGGPSRDLGNSLRLGSLIAGALILAVFVSASATSRRKNALSRERSLMQTMVERMAEGITIIDPNLTLVACNDHFYSLYNLPKDRFKTPVQLE
ncbi:MAG: CHASE domain-containing protein, partial [Alphaproteobacteria bacterium]|nr:CHASE domain-containing protein [Alphaproteobacteria bacterium]